MKTCCRGAKLTWRSGNVLLGVETGGSLNSFLSKDNREGCQGEGAVHAKT